MRQIRKAGIIKHIDVTKSMRWAADVACIEEKENACRISVRKSELRRDLRELNSEWKDNIKINLKESICKRGMD
jgi:hypothetical protein